MSRTAPSLPRSDASTPEGPETLGEAQVLLRDVIALSTLPAMWMGAEATRIAESLLAVLETTVGPLVSYIRIPPLDPRRGAAVELANVAGLTQEAETTRALGETICAWAAKHDPDEVLEAALLPGGAVVRLCAYPLGHEPGAGVLAAGFALNEGGRPSPGPLQRTLLNIAANQAITTCRNLALQHQAEAARNETQALYEVSQALAAELDLQAILQKTTDAVTRLTGAKFGAFFHNVIDAHGESYQLYTLSGAPREAFDKFGMPRNTPVFDHTFRGTGVVRADDVTKHPLYGKMAPHHGLPRGHLPVRSYLAVPVRSRTGEVFGGLFLAHPEPGVFAERDERIALGIAGQAAVALDNARLFARANSELTQRKEAEEALRESEGRLRLITDAVPALISYVDAEGRYRFTNKAYREWFGAGPEDFAGRFLRDLVSPEGFARLSPHIQEALSGKRVTFETEMSYPDGGTRFVLAHYVPDRRPDGSVLGFYALVHDITQRRQMEELLREGDQRKDEFLATLSHELRNPLAPIRNAVGMLKLSKNEPARMEGAIAIIERQSSHLLRLIDDLLDISRITRGKVELRKERVALASLIDQAVEAIRPLCDARGLKLTMSVPPAPLYLEADPVRVVQILGNLLNNACKYSPPGGVIAVGVEADGDHVQLRVRDTGIGLAPEQLTRIFEMFVQVESSSSRAPGGLGIGLSLARTLAEMHGGTIEARSEGPGRGSEFVVRFPALPRAPAHAEAEPPPPQSEGPETPELRVVAVDDYDDALESLAMLVEALGHSVHTARDGEEALQLVSAKRPDVVLLDIGLPRMDGYEVAKRIRARPEGRGVLLVAMTGWGQEQDKQKATEAGFDVHLTKPADPARLEQLLEDRARRKAEATRARAG